MKNLKEMKYAIAVGEQFFLERRRQRRHDALQESLPCIRRRRGWPADVR
jgi:hypothetical protein